MDAYSLLKLAHVALAMVWVGGASVLTLVVVVLMRKGDDEGTLAATSYLALLGMKVFAPVGGATILSGVVLGWMGGWFWQAWTVLALAIVAGTFALGAAYLGPSTDRVVALWRGGDTPGAMAVSRRVMGVVSLDLGAQWTIISLMVLRPGWTDPSLIVALVPLALGAALAARRAAQPVAA